MKSASGVEGQRWLTRKNLVKILFGTVFGDPNSLNGKREANQKIIRGTRRRADGGEKNYQQ